MSGGQIRIGLPGAISDGPDLDLEDGNSPVKKARGAPSTASGGEITADVLKQLLWEQSQMLLSAQQTSTAQLQTAINELDSRHTQRLDAMDAKLTSQGDKVGDMEHQMQLLSDRLSRVEKGQASAAGSGPDRRATLVFGGWQAQTRKQTLLHQLSESIKSLGLQGEFDQEPFCTGMRRSVALCNFRKREYEGGRWLPGSHAEGAPGGE